MKRPVWILTIILSAIFLVSIVQHVQATTLDYFQVQHRNLENGTLINRVQFGGNPENGSFPIDPTTFSLRRNNTPVVLTINNGQPLEFSAFSYNSLPGTYAGSNSASFTTWQPQINYSANVDSPLNSGTYEMGLNNFNNRVSVYNGLDNLPVVKSSSIDLSDAFLANGDFDFNWDSPLNMRDNLTYTAVIDGFIGNTLLNEISVGNIPFYINSLIIPKSILDSLGPIDFMRLHIETRSVDGSNRGISNSIDAKFPVPEPTTFLLLGAGLIGLAGYGRKKFNK